MHWTCRSRRRSSTFCGGCSSVHRLAYLFISHDLKVVRALAHRIVVLRHGRMVEQGDADTVFAHPREDYTRALMAAAFTLEDRGVSGDAVPAASSL